MKDEKKITAPKRKKTIPAAKKESAAEQKTLPSPEKKAALDEFKIDLVGAIKPARKTETAEKPAIKKALKKAKSASEALEIVPAAAEKPRRRKSIIKKESAAPAAQTAAKKNAPKRTNGKSADTAAKPGKKARETETAKQTEQSNITLTVKAFAGLENILSSEIEAAPTLRTGAKENAPIEELAVSVGKSTAAVSDSPVFRELAAPSLPVLQAENRARLQMQSPTRLFFYWSLKSNPFETLQKVFGGRNAQYSLAVKLQNQTNQTEQIFPVFPIDSSGSSWFDVESDSEYRAEIGFAAAHRPFIRLLLSNAVETPRGAPSPLLDRSPQFAVTPQKFAEVLDASGYQQDAFEIALTGGDLENSNAKTFETFERLTGGARFEARASELRLALFALAAGLSPSDLRGQISPRLFGYLEKLLRENAARLSAEKVLAALEENFGFGNLHTEDEPAETAYSVVGASRVNFQKFPKQFWKRFAPLSSLRP